MAEIGSITLATSSDLTNAVSDVTIASAQTDGITGQDETEYQNPNWTKYLGYYKNIPEVKIATDTMAIWTIGDGFKADPETEVILDHITGFGTDTFDDILENLDKTSRIGGDAFAEIIRDEESGVIVNLKPLDPSTIKIIVNSKGVIKRYEQTNKLGDKKTIQKFSTDKILHIVNKRIADEIHGESDYRSIEEIIKALNESFVDMRQLMHRHVKPIMAFKLDTDDQGKINAFVAKMDQIINKGENIYIPKDSVEFELVSVPSNSTLNPLPWREDLKNYFYQVVGIPQILMGGASEFSESSAKIAYLSFEQTIKQRQRAIIMAIWNQLGLRIDLDFPTSLKNEMLTDEKKDANQGMEFQPGDTTAGVAR